jgi:hypothetical protein
MNGATRKMSGAGACPPGKMRNRADLDAVATAPEDLTSAGSSKLQRGLVELLDAAAPGAQPADQVSGVEKMPNDKKNQDKNSSSSMQDPNADIFARARTTGDQAVEDYLKDAAVDKNGGQGHGLDVTHSTTSTRAPLVFQAPGKRAKQGKKMDGRRPSHLLRNLLGGCYGGGGWRHMR